MTLMTVGELSRRTAVPVKALREYNDLGLIYSVGRTAGNYRLFDESALWCVEVIRTLRALGLTIVEIRELAGAYLGQPGQPIGPRLADMLGAARRRIDCRIAELQAQRRRIEEFETAYADDLAGDAAGFRATDPRSRSVGA
jgi:DNA-binding transcriptional MerR regulator